MAAAAAVATTSCCFRNSSLKTFIACNCIHRANLRLFVLNVRGGFPWQQSNKTRSIQDSKLAAAYPYVKLTFDHRHVILDNGLVKTSLSNPGGHVSEVWYRGVQTLERRNPDRNRGYWDVVWYEPGSRRNIDGMPGSSFRIVHQDSDLVEVAFSRSWNFSRRGFIAPLNVEKRYIMRRGSSGFYAYAVVERLKGWPDTTMDQLRIVFKLDKDRFEYMAISEERQRVMPRQEDRDRGKRLAYPEAVLLTNTSNKAVEGEVDDKYQYSLEHQDNRVHGWVSTRDMIGFWMIFPSYEFRTGGPTKQELTSHVGPTLLGMFGSTHYAGRDMDTTYRSSEAWKMVYGPVFIYLNSASPSSSPTLLYQDAQSKMKVEESQWPYGFIHSADFLPQQQRGSVSGQLIVRDPYMRRTNGSGAHMGLAQPGEAGSWQRDGKNYQFWNKTNNQGGFLIDNVRPGKYNLYGWVPGILGDYKLYKDIVITPRSHIELGLLTFEPPRNGPTVWEIGVPDRSAAEFFVPEPEPTNMNKLYKDLPKDWYRQYGLWERYSKLFPVEDVNFTIGVHDYTKDWYFAQVTREVNSPGSGAAMYEATNWRINFELQEVDYSGNYTFRMALAGAFDSKIEIIFNYAYQKHPHPMYITERVGTDNGIARHGIHGLHWIYAISVPPFVLRQGHNCFVLRQAHAMGPFNGVMYDYLRLEGPPKKAH